MEDNYVMSCQIPNVAKNNPEHMKSIIAQMRDKLLSRVGEEMEEDIWFGMRLRTKVEEEIGCGDPLAPNKIQMRVDTKVLPVEGITPFEFKVVTYNHLKEHKGFFSKLKLLFSKEKVYTKELI